MQNSSTIYSDRIKLIMKMVAKGGAKKKSLPAEEIDLR